MTDQPPTNYASKKTDGLAVAALVLGILAFVILPVIGAVLAIVFGVQSRHRIDADPSLDGRSMATAGVVLGIVELVLVSLTVLLVAGLSSG